MPSGFHLLGQALADGFEGELAGVVNAHPGEGFQAPDAGDVEHVAAFPLAQVGQYGPQHVQRTKHIHVELAVDFLGVDFLDAAQRAVTRIIDNDIEVAELADGVGNGLFHLGLVGYFHHEAVALAVGFLGELVGLRLLAEGRGYFIAFFEEQIGQRSAKSGANAGNEPVFGSCHKSCVC